MDQPLVSICIPAYNAAATIEATLKSALAQTYKNIEITVVDNCSTDNTVALIKAFDNARVSVTVNETNVGAIPNWTLAVEATNGVYIKLLCADDTIDPTIVERQVAILEDPTYSEVVMVATRRRVIDNNDKVIVKARGLAGMKGLVSSAVAIRKIAMSGGNPIGESAAVLFRAEAIKKCLPWRDTFPYLVDVDMWSRLLEHGSLYAIPESLAAFRVSGGSWSGQVRHQQIEQSKAMMHDLHRRHPKDVSKFDANIGAAHAVVIGQTRRFAYWWLKRKGSDANA